MKLHEECRGTMNSTQISTLMIPVAEYVTVDENATLGEAFQKMEAFAKDKKSKKIHRDMLVTRKGKVVGKITIADILKAIEPAYRNIKPMNFQGGALNNKLAESIFRDFDLWSLSLEELCKRASVRTVKSFMPVPSTVDFIDENDSLEEALHKYLLKAEQPLLVRRGEEVVGALRLGDLFEYLRSVMSKASA